MPSPGASIVKFIPSGLKKRTGSMRGSARYPVERTLALLVALPFIISSVLGIGVQVQPDTIQEGGQISIALSNVTDGYTLNTTLTAAFPPASRTSWLNFTNWYYPFTLEGGGVTVSGQNVNRITLLVRVGSTLRGVPPKPGTGNITVELPMDLLPSLYHDFRIEYEVHNTSAPLVFTLVQQGTKVGPEDALLTPSITGIGEGNLAVMILTNGTLEGSKEIRIQESAPLPTPTAENTEVTLSPTPTSSPTPPPVTTTTAPVPSPSASPPVTPTPTPSPAPSSESPVLLIIGFAAVIILIAIIADYFLLRD
jgi:hypothetical protein